jgi:hypothetical protein
VARGDTVYGDAKGCLGSVVGLVVILGVIGLLYEYWYVTLPVVGVILSISLWHRWAGGYLRGEEHHGVIRFAMPAKSYGNVRILTALRKPLSYAPARKRSEESGLDKLATSIVPPKVLEPFRGTRHKGVSQSGWGR